jgi:hypothetical protein
MARWLRLPALWWCGMSKGGWYSCDGMRDCYIVAFIPTGEMFLPKSKGKYTRGLCRLNHRKKPKHSLGLSSDSNDICYFLLSRAAFT